MYHISLKYIIMSLIIAGMFNCDTSPCNMGSCVDTIDGYGCVCEAGYTGTYCELGEQTDIFIIVCNLYNISLFLLTLLWHCTKASNNLFLGILVLIKLWPS